MILMPLSSKNLSDIASEFATANDETASAKSSITSIQEQIVGKQKQVDNLYIPYNDSNIERVIPYQIERRWIDGTTYTDITQQQIDDAGARVAGNIFYPSGWIKNNAQLTANGNGNPTSSSTNSESAILNATVANQGLTSQIDLLINGQSSGVTSHILSSSYTPGAATISITTGTQTIGKFLYIAGSGTSALVIVTNAVGTTISISEIIAPASTIATAGSTIVENIPGFTNAERQNLTSVNYQRILTQLTNRIIAAAALYKTALDNQLTQLKINIDKVAEITVAKTSVTNAQTAYNTWFALSNTGANGKFADVSLTPLMSSYNSRNSGFSARINQITTALGSVSQDSKGEYSGSGQYMQRFKCLNFLINTANGPLYQVNTLNIIKADSQQKVTTNTDKLTTLSNIVRYGSFTTDSTETNVVNISGATQFSISDNVIVTATDLPAIETTITGISGSNVTLGKVVPKTFTKALKSGIIKRV